MSGKCQNMKHLTLLKIKEEKERRVGGRNNKPTNLTVAHSFSKSLTWVFEENI